MPRVSSSARSLASLLVVMATVMTCSTYSGGALFLRSPLTMCPTYFLVQSPVVSLIRYNGCSGLTSAVASRLASARLLPLLFQRIMSYNLDGHACI